MRVVSGTAGTGGSVAFTTAFASQAVAGSVTISGSVDGTTLSTSQIPAHNHPAGDNGHTHGFGLPVTVQGGNPANPGAYLGGNNTWFSNSGNGYTSWNGGSTGTAYAGVYTNNTGGGSSHNHTVGGVSGAFSGTAINLAVQYVDTIIATKN